MIKQKIIDSNKNVLFLALFINIFININIDVLNAQNIDINIGNIFGHENINIFSERKTKMSGSGLKKKRGRQVCI